IPESYRFDRSIKESIGLDMSCIQDIDSCVHLRDADYGEPAMLAYVRSLRLRVVTDCYNPPLIPFMGSSNQPGMRTIRSD
ncbi:hypothetical protein HYV73_02935, partial [Candidatus Uhrbacteria bacterium]|nr:hypothetical protein [Candidatus Uhrbacteria bacterium]